MTTPYYKYTPGEFAHLRPAVCVLIRHPDTGSRRHLMIQRAKDDVGGGFWTPVTGSCDDGEPQELAVVREVLEETGLQVRPLRRLWECPNSFRTHVLHWWLAEPTAAAIADELRVTPQPGEVDDFRWCTLADALQLTPMFEDTQYFFEQFGTQLHDD
ncbi:MAG: NUDIX hydrolase [Planctomycetota bacterium]